MKLHGVSTYDETILNSGLHIMFAGKFFAKKKLNQLDSLDRCDDLAKITLLYGKAGLLRQRKNNGVCSVREGRWKNHGHFSERKVIRTHHTVLDIRSFPLIYSGVHQPVYQTMIWWVTQGFVQQILLFNLRSVWTMWLSVVVLLDSKSFFTSKFPFSALPVLKSYTPP